MSDAIALTYGVVDPVKPAVIIRARNHIIHAIIIIFHKGDSVGVIDNSSISII